MSIRRKNIAPHLGLTTLNRGIGFAVIALVIWIAGSATSGSATVSWRGDYETNDFGQWDCGTQQKASGRATTVSSPVRQGRFAARYEVRPGDTDVAGSGSNGERTEALSCRSFGEGDEQWWAWSTMFASDFSASNSGWNLFTQWHNSGTSGGTVAFFVKGSELFFQSYGGNLSSATSRSWKIADRTNGAWYDIVFHVKWSSNASVGLVEVFVNGSQVVPLTSTATLYSGQTVYLKQGYYRAAQPNVAVIYHDGMRQGTGYADVAAEFAGGSSSTTNPTATLTMDQNIVAGQKLTGTVPWTATPLGKTVSRVDFTIDDSVKWTESGAPWVFNGDGHNLDTSTLGNGSHVLASTAYATDGTTAAASATVTVSNAVAERRSPPTVPMDNLKLAPPKPPASVSQTTLEANVTLIQWDGLTFQTTGAFRSYLIGLGVEWSRFLDRHPSLAHRTGLPVLRWDGKNFYEQTSLKRHLASKGTGYQRWASDHPVAAAVLAGRAVTGTPRTVAQAIEKPVVVTWDGIGFTTAARLRLYVVRRGADWNGFLVSHPAIAQRLALASVRWDGKRWYTRAALSQWLVDRGITISAWDRAHPGLADKLMS